MSAVENRFTSSDPAIVIRSPFGLRKFFAYANLNRGAMIAALSAFFRASLLASPCRIPCCALFCRWEMMKRSLRPLQNPGLRVVFKAFFKKSLRKTIDVLDRFSWLTRGWSAVFSNRLTIHRCIMCFGFSAALQPNAASGAQIL